MTTPNHNHLAALLACIQLGLRQEILNHLAGQPRAQAYDSDKTTGGGGSDPTATAATTPDRARHDLEAHDAAVDRAYRALLTLAALSDHYLPTHEPRKADIARDTRGCTLHLRAGIDAHQPAARRTDFGTVLAQPLKDPLDVCQACYDHVRAYAKLPTNEELVRHHRTGKWTARVTSTWSVESVAATRPGEAA